MKDDYKISEIATPACTNQMMTGGRVNLGCGSDAITSGY
jgi:hypothetical protein